MFEWKMRLIPTNLGFQITKEDTNKQLKEFYINKNNSIPRVLHT
jgi:hypothetical protein